MNINEIQIRRRPVFSALTLSFALLLCGRATARVYGGIDFPQGAASFADAVHSYDPYFSGGPAPTAANFSDPGEALGVPDYTGGPDGEGAVALGRGGKLELVFKDLVLVNSGDAAFDLAIFEVGPLAERVLVGLRPANLTTRTTLGAACIDALPPNDAYCEIGAFPGGTIQVDIDAFFPSLPSGALRFDAAQIIDDPNEGNHTGTAPGADIDAVGAIQAGVITCGDGLVEQAEECDDGGRSAGDGCSPECTEVCWECTGEPSACETLPDGTACEDGNVCTTNDQCSGVVCVGGPPPDCDDQNVCTEDGCNPAYGCVHPPKTGPCDDGSTCSINDACSGGVCVGDAVLSVGCREPGSALLLLRDRQPDTGDAFIWKWKKGTTAAEEFGDPARGSTTYELCVFDRKGSSDRLRLGVTIMPGGVCDGEPCWKAQDDKGFRYKNADPAHGIRRLLLKAEPAGSATILAKGKGETLPMPDLPLSGRVKVQLKNADVCWEAEYNDPVLNQGGKYKAKQ